MTDKYGKHASAYDLNEVGGFRKSYRQLLIEAKQGGKAYDLGFWAELNQARIRERRNLEKRLSPRINLENKANN
jgi:hypothetical protein